MKTAQRLAILTAYSLGVCFQFAPEAGATPLVPLEWQTRVKAGAMENQRKHVGWVRDLNQNFVADKLDTMPPDERVTVILEMNECLTRAEIDRRFAAFGVIRRVGRLLAYIVMDNVRAGDAVLIAADPAVAAVENDEPVFLFNNIATRSVRARASTTFSPETFANAHPGFDGSGISIAIMDTGVDDAVHGAFAGKFVSGYNALTATPGNPNDDLALSPSLGTGANGICNTTAAGDDTQLVPVGQGFPDPGFGFPIRAILPGANGVIDTVPAGDDSTSTAPCDGVTPYLRPGPDGICNSAAAGDDIQLIPVGQGYPGIVGVQPGANGVIDTVPVGDDEISPGVWHGTHVAGISLGLGVGTGRIADDGSLPNDGQGMAPGAGLVDVKVFNSLGGGATDAVIIDGLEWIWMDGNARVLNMSLGNSTMSDGTSTLSKTINALVENGITVVVAAGNDGGNCLGDIAASELAITVAASDDRGTVDRDDDRFASFSTFGPRVDFTGVPISEVRVGQLKPDIAAPGVDIISAQGDSAGSYHSLDGTSMAAPNVTGAAALLLDLRPDITPGSLKELLKRSAYITPQHAALGPSFPAVDGAYNINWGFGLLDVYQACVNLSAGIADITFPACTAPDCGGNCDIPGEDYANSADILVATFPPVRGEPNTITVNVENRTAALAENVVVCVGVYELGSGLGHFYAVGCKTIDLAALASAAVSFPWTPTVDEHQCIQATINYGFDTDFCNNQTQRNTDTVAASSTATVTFRVENPLNETALIVLNPQFAGGDDNIRGVLRSNQFTLRPEDCAVLGVMDFTPNPASPIGTRATFNVAARAITASHPEGVELSGVQFEVVVVAAGLERAYSVGRHGPEGSINLRLNLAGLPTSDPRLTVNEILAVFNVTVGTSNNVTLSPQQVLITSSAGNPIPPYTVAFAGGGNTGKELTIRFSQSLPNRDRYRISFARFVDTDGDPLRGDTDVEVRVLQGDANSSGAVTGTDVSFVRGRINQQAAFGDPSRSDVNMTGATTGTDISFVRSRIGNSAP